MEAGPRYTDQGPAMAIALLIIASLLLYGKSKYFPDELKQQLNLHRLPMSLSMTVGTLLLLSAYVACAYQYDLLTAGIIWALALMMIFSSLIVTIKLNPVSIYLWAVLGVITVTIDLL